MRPLLTLTIAIALILLVAPTRGGAMDFTALGNAPGEEYFLYFNLAKLPPKPQVVFFDFRDSSNYRVLNLEQGKLSLSEQVDGKWKTLDSAKIAPTAAGSLVIKRHSSYAAAVLNGETVVSGPVSKALGDVYGTGSEGECTVSFQRCQPLDKVIFADSFMRTDSPGEWEIESGFWEICGLSFSEQSANPFSLFCRFASSGALEEPSDDRIYEDRIGIGVAMDPRGHISRIAGQAPAADAGLQQDDIIETINGQPVAMNWNRLETARVGEKFVLQIRRGGNRFTVAVVARRYRWGEIEKRFPLQPATLAPLAMIRAGFPFWDDYTFRASVRPMGEGMAGLAFYVTDAQNYYAFRWWGDNSLRKGRTNTLELVRVRGGVEDVLASADGGFYPDQYYEMKVRIVKDAIECQIDGAVVFTLSYPQLASGSVALIAADGYGVYFDDVRVASTDIYADPPRKRRVNEVFSRQGDMRDWADPTRDWTTRFVRGGNATFLSKYHVFGGADLIVHPEADFVKLDVTAFADDDYKGGTQITLDERGSVEVISGIAANRDSIKGTVKLDRTIPIVIRCDRKTVAVLQSDRRLFEARTPSAPKGSFFVVKGLRSLMANGSQVIELSGGNTRDYTFEESPTDWFVVDGKWGVTNKWICDPRWSWFGGTNMEGYAAVSSKFRLEGDYSLDAYFATLMLVNDPPYEMLGNYGVTVNSDGLTPASGDTLLVGGGMNYWTGVARKGEFRYTSSRYMENARRDNTFNHPQLPADNRLQYLSNEVVHQRWYHVRMVRRGGKLNISFEGKEVFNLNDEDGSAAGKVLLWTYRNGWMLSRVRVSADNIVDDAPVFRHETAIRTSAWADGRFARRNRLLAKLDQPDEGCVSATVTEPGEYSLHSTVGDVDLVRFPALGMKMSATGQTGADLYFSFGGSEFRVRIAGPIDDDVARPTVGKVAFTPDGKPHDLVIPIRAFLEDYLGTRVTGTVTGIKLAQHNGDDYALAGLNGGALPGATFTVWPVRPIPASTSAPKIVPFPDGKPELMLAFEDGSCGFYFNKATVSLAGKVIKGARFEPAPEGRTIRVALPHQFALKEGNEVTFEISGVLGTDGSPVAPWSSGVFRYKAASDKTPPVILDIWPNGAPLAFEDFETGDGGYGLDGKRRLSGTALSRSFRDTTTASSGRSSMKLISEALGSLMINKVLDATIVVDQPLVLAVDYRMKLDVPLSFYLGNRDTAIVWNDQAVRNRTMWGSGKEIYTNGADFRFDEPNPDGTWRTASTVLAPRGNSARTYHSLSVADLGFRGCYRNDFVNLDNIRVFRLSGVPAAEPELRFAELGEIAEIRTSITAAPAEPTGRWKPGDMIPRSLELWFNVMARDAAGNWSEPRSFQFFCDSVAPVLRNVVWRDRVLSFFVTDDWAVSRESLVVESAGKTYKYDGRQVTWSLNGMVIVQTASDERKAEVVVRDSAGNEARFRIDGKNVTRLGVTEDL